MNNPDEALQPARDRLATAVAALIDPQRVTLPEGRTTWLDSLYQQLIDEITDRSRLLGGRSSEPALPVWTEGLDALTEIDTTIRREHPPKPPFVAQKGAQAPLRATVWRLQEIDKRTWRPQDVPHIDEFSTDLERLTIKTRNLLCPPHGLIFVPAACPYCDATHIEIRNEHGEPATQPALRIIRPDEGKDYCRCANPDCDGWWDNLPRLGLLLGNDPVQGLITT